MRIKCSMGRNPIGAEARVKLNLTVDSSTKALAEAVRRRTGYSSISSLFEALLRLEDERLQLEKQVAARSLLQQHLAKQATAARHQRRA